MTSTGINIGMENEGRPSSKAMRPSPSGGGESRDIFGAEGTGLPGHHRVAQPPGGHCNELFGSRYSGLPSHHRIAQPPGGRCNQLFEPEYSGSPNPHNRHRVLKPPGGGSSDIFGSEGAQPAARRNARQAMQSSLFSDKMETTTNSKTAKSVPNTRRNPINHCGMTDADCSTKSFSSIRTRGSERRPDGNPVTGEGYAIANGVKESAATNGIMQTAVVAEVASTIETCPKTNGTAKSAPPSRPGRVPPGGFSSGLW